MRPWIGAAFALAAAAWLAGATARGQVIERDTKVTGPRGRTIERQVRTQRGPGYIERDVDIRRPAGEFHRETIIRDGQGYGPGPGPGPWVGGGGPRGFYPGGPVFVERDVIYAPPPPPRPSGFFALGLPFFGLSVGGPPLLPPPVVVGPPPVIVVSQAPAYVAAPQPSQGQAAPPVAVVDPLTVPLNQLQSYHASQRRDGSLALGSQGDPRAVPALMDRLKADGDREVRIAAAWALGEIGDPRAAVYLERAALFDKKPDVREAAAAAYKRLHREGTPAPAPADPASATESPPPPEDANTPPPPPMPDGGFRETP